LVWEIKPGTDTEISETLHRGDELLAVDGQLVERKKLADIYKLILRKVPAEVKLKIKEIQHNICSGEGTWYFCTNVFNNNFHFTSVVGTDLNYWANLGLGIRQTIRK
jgi:hypothetical protein